MSRCFRGLVVIVLGFVAVPSWAALKFWNDGTDNWTNGANWTPAGVPAAGDFVRIMFADDTARTITYDYSGVPIAVGDLILDLTGAGSNATTLSMAANALTTSEELIGLDGRGTFNQSGGTHTINGGGLSLGNNPNGKGAYNLSGSGTLLVSSSEYVGGSGAGNFNQSGGSNSLSGAGHDLYLAFGPGSGTYTLTGGSLSAGVHEFVGYAGTGTFDHSAGTNTVTFRLNIGWSPAATGTYSLSGTGQLSVNDQIIVGFEGNGTFNQSGGVNVVGINGLTIGSLGTSLGTYALSAGTLTVHGSEVVGSYATGNGVQSGGTFTQTGGSQTIDNYLTVGDIAGSTGDFSLSNGSLVSSLDQRIGNNGTGSFSQSGGANTTANDINIGYGAGSSGNYTINSGTTNAANIYVGGRSGGPGGTGVLAVNGSSGVLNVTNIITIYNTPATSLNLQSGTLNTGGINVNGLPSLFNWSGGTLNITKDVTWDSGAGATATGAAFGSSLSLSSNRTLRINGDETIGGNGVFSLSVGSGIHTVTGNITLKPSGSISQSSTGTIGYANFTQAGGTISSFFRNNTNFTYQSGSISAQFVNDGTMTLGSSLTITNSFQNDSLMTVAANQTFTATSGINNFGNFVVAGGTIGQSSSFTNSIGGTLTAHGTINPTITNHGTMVVDGVLSLGVSLNNDGIIQGAGTVNLISTFSNNAGGVINATTPGGVLSFANLVNSAGSAVNVGPSSTLSITGNWTNSGIVNLQGSGSRLSGGIVTNNGIIQGFGTITAAMATSNTGVFRVSGGELDFTALGATNSNQSQFQILAGGTAMFLQGMSINSGTISLLGGALDNNNRTLSNNSTINGYGTIRTGGLTNSGGRLISVGEGNMDVLGTVTNNGVISIQSGRSAYFFNNVSGSGSFTGTGTAVFLASLSPGNSPAQVNFAGGATLGGGTSLVMELGGSAVGTGYDKIDVEGQLSLGGVLSVSLINGFVPVAWSSFDLLDWGSLSGTFSSLSLPTLPVGQWDTSKLYVDGTLSVSLGGDFDHNGAVNAGDYVVWRKGLGTIYSAADYDLWRAHYGEGSSGSGIGSAASVAAVPEPGTVVLALTLVAAGMLRRCRRQV